MTDQNIVERRRAREDYKQADSPTFAALRSVWCVNRPVSGLMSGLLQQP